MPDRSKGRGQTKSGTLVLLVGGWVWGQRPYPVKINIAMEISTSNSLNNPTVDLNQPVGSMTTSDQSPWEVRGVKESLLGPKAKIRIGAWNVRTMFETSKTAQVLKEMQRYNLDILGISECRWTGTGRS